MLSFHDFILQQDVTLVSEQSKISSQQTTQITQLLLVEHNLCHSPFILSTTSFIVDNKLSTPTILAKTFFLKQLQTNNIFTPPKTIS